MTQDLGQPSRTIKLVIAYDGTDFCGWQKQPGQRTVQDEIEQVLRRVLRHPLTHPRGGADGLGGACGWAGGAPGDDEPDPGGQPAAGDEFAAAG